MYFACLRSQVVIQVKRRAEGVSHLYHPAKLVPYNSFHTKAQQHTTRSRSEMLMQTIADELASLPGLAVDQSHHHITSINRCQHPIWAR